MATNQKISELTSRAFGDVTGDEQVPVSESGSNYRISIKNLISKADINSLSTRAYGSVTGDETVPANESGSNFKIATKNLFAKADLTALSTASTYLDGDTYFPVSASAGVNYKAPLRTLLSGNKNYLDNSAMRIWTRSSPVAVSAGTPTFGPDRWDCTYGGTMTATLAGDNDVPTRTYAYIQRNSGQTSTTVCAITQSMLTTDARFLRGKPVVLSFYSKKAADFSASSSYLVSGLYTGTGSDERFSSGFTGQATVATQNNVLTTSWQRFYMTGTITAAGAGQIQIAARFLFTPTGTAGTNDGFYISGIKLEEGSLATPYEQPRDPEETQRCAHFLEKLGGNTNNEYYCVGGATANNSATVALTYGMPKRSVPTITRVGTLQLYDLGGGGSGVALNSFSTANIGLNSAELVCGVATTPFAAGEAVLLRSNGTTSDYLLVSAEI